LWKQTGTDRRIKSVGDNSAKYKFKLKIKYHCPALRRGAMILYENANNILSYAV